MGVCWGGAPRGVSCSHRPAERVDAQGDRALRSCSVADFQLLSQPCFCPVGSGSGVALRAVQGSVKLGTLPSSLLLLPGF